MRMLWASCLWALCYASVGQAADDWVLKSGDWVLLKSTLTTTLQARGFQDQAADPKQRDALLQELFIRETLLAQQQKVPAPALAQLDQQLDDYRKTQLSKLVLDHLALAGAPDFNRRAEELYAARKDSDYRLPLRLRVRVLEKKVTEEAASNETAVRASLDALRSQIATGQLEFRAAVLAHSDAENRKLAEGDSFWFHSGQKASAFFEAAAQLSPAQPLSEVFVHQGRAYLLQFIGRQEAMQQTYAEVKDQILAELTQEYQKEQRRQILDGLRIRFQQEVERHPDYQ